MIKRKGEFGFRGQNTDKSQLRVLFIFIEWRLSKRIGKRGSLTFAVKAELMWKMKIFLKQQMILVLVQQISRKFLTSKLTHKKKKIIDSMMCLFFWGNQYLLKQLKDSENKSWETIHVSTYYQEAENCERIDVMDVTEKLGHTESVPQFSSAILKFVPWVEIIIAMHSFQFGFLTMKLCLKT